MKLGFVSAILPEQSLQQVAQLLWQMDRRDEAHVDRGRIIRL